MPNLLFCKLSSLDSSNAGFPGDCGVFFIALLGFVWLTVLWFRWYKQRFESASSARASASLFSASSLLKQAPKVSGSASQDGLGRPLMEGEGSVSIDIGGSSGRNVEQTPHLPVALTFKATTYTWICVLLALLAMISLILGTISKFDQCNYIAFYVTLLLGFVGWLLTASILSIPEAPMQTSSSSATTSPTPPINVKLKWHQNPICAVVGWSVTQMIVSGINTDTSEFKYPSVGYSACVTASFICSIIITVQMTCKLLKIDNLFHFIFRRKETFSSYMSESKERSPMRPSDSKFNSGDATNNNSILPSQSGGITTLWAVKKVNGSFSQRDVNRNSHEIDMDEDGDSDGNNNKRSSFLDKESGMFGNGSGAVFGRSTSVTSIGSVGSHSSSSTAKFREKAQDAGGAKHGLTVSVYDWEKSQLDSSNSSAAPWIVVYKITVIEVVGSTREKKSFNILKRYEEIAFLHEKILSEFPSISGSIPAVPPLPGKDTQKVSHLEAITKYIERLLAHQLTTRLVSNFIRSSIDNQKQSKPKLQIHPGIVNVGPIESDTPQQTPARPEKVKAVYKPIIKITKFGIGLKTLKDEASKACIVLHFKDLAENLPNPCLTCSPPLQVNDVIIGVNETATRDHDEIVQLVTKSVDVVVLWIERFELSSSSTVPLSSPDRFATGTSYPDEFTMSPIAASPLASSFGATGGGLMIPSHLNLNTGNVGSVNDVSANLSTNSGLDNPVPAGFPLLLRCNKAELRVECIGWADVSLNKKEKKIFYEVRVQHRDETWVLQKRFRQFRALFYVLENQNHFEGGIQISYPTKHSQRRSKPVSLLPEEEEKLGQNVTSLNSFLQSCLLNMKTYPPVFIAFLESQIVRRNNGFDVAKGSDGTIEFICTNENNLVSRLNKLEKFDAVSMKKMINGQIGPLNLLEDRVVRSGSMFSRSSSNSSQVSTDNNRSSSSGGGTGMSSESAFVTNTTTEDEAEGFDDRDLRESFGGGGGGDEDDEDLDSQSYRASSSASSSPQKEGRAPLIGAGGNSYSNSNSNNSGRGSLFERMKTKSMNETKDLLAVPGNALADLIEILRILRVHEVTEESGCRLNFLPGHFMIVIDAKRKSRISDEGIDEFEAKSAQSSGRGEFNSSTAGCWLAQWRVRNVVLSTSAFADVGKAVESLKLLNPQKIKDFPDNAKLSFILNLYNLISLHSALIYSWPKVDDKAARALWMANSCYKIGSNTLSLLDIEFGLLRVPSCLLHPLDLPSIPGSSILIPTPTDLKYYAPLTPTSKEPRISFALALPFQSSSMLFTYSAANVMQELKFTTLMSLFSKISLVGSDGKAVVSIPKVMRMYYKDYLGWKESTGLMNYKAIAGAIIKNHQIQFSMVDTKTPTFFCGLRVVDEKGSSDLGPTVGNLKDISWDMADQNAKIGDMKPVSPGSSCQSSFRIATGRPSSSGSSSLAAATDGGDVAISEDEIRKLSKLLESFVDMRDRRVRLNTYKNCFVGSEAVAAFVASGYAKSNVEALLLGDKLIEYGVVRHVTGDQWMKDQKDQFYNITNYVSPAPAQLEPYENFLWTHLLYADSMGFLPSSYRRQFKVAVDNESKALYSAENYAFSFAIPHSPSHTN